MTWTKWLNCTVSRGQFSDEVAVRGSDYSGREFSLFVPRSYVHCEQWPEAGESVSAFLQVEVLDQRDRLYLVRLPGPTFDNGSTITVRTENLESAVREPA